MAFYSVCSGRIQLLPFPQSGGAALNTRLVTSEHPITLHLSRSSGLNFSLFSVYVLSTFHSLLLSWKPKLAPANYRADTNWQGGTWRGMLGLIKECKPGLVLGLCDCASTPLPSEIPDIYWSIFIQSVRSLMLSMCYLAALQRSRTCFQMFHGESSSPVKAVPSRLSRLPLIRDNITCFGLRTPP